MSEGRMDLLIRSVLRKELSLGFQPAHRVPLDVEGGATEAGDRYCWGVWNHEKQVLMPEMSPAIVGYIEGVGVKEANEWKGQRKFKLVLHLDCGATGQYAIRSGLETAFSKGLVNLLASLSPNQARSPVKLIVKPGDDSSGKVVLASMYAEGDHGMKWVKPVFEFPKDINDIRALYRGATDVVPKLDLRSFEERQRSQQDEAA